MEVTTTQKPKPLAGQWRGKERFKRYLGSSADLTLVLFRIRERWRQRDGELSKYDYDFPQSLSR